MPLPDLVQSWIARGFADFPGLAVDGSIPLKQELVNQAIAELLASAATGESTGPPAMPPALLQLVKQLEVSATEGVITVHVKLRA